MNKTEKQTLEWYQSQPERYNITSIGAVIDLTIKGKNSIVTSFPELNPYTITKENSQAMHMQRRIIGARSKL
jgi:hypothetical protein